MTELELAICKRLSEAGPSVAGDSPKAKAVLQSLADRGYCKLSPARCGPLGVLTGETMVGITEAGRAALSVTCGSISK
ncbi:hypothetical protein [Ralstonia sp. OTU4908]|uniref:hypothetical protein n=1 Tax=Ralstonia sp. OTU4908 TaxID=3043851 RepID=UPI00313F0781